MFIWFASTLFPISYRELRCFLTFYWNKLIFLTTNIHFFFPNLLESLLFIKNRLILMLPVKYSSAIIKRSKYLYNKYFVSNYKFLFFILFLRIFRPLFQRLRNKSLSQHLGVYYFQPSRSLARFCRIFKLPLQQETSILPYSARF